jgi:hypothetical protein
MRTLGELITRLKLEDRGLYCAALALKKMKGELADQVAEDVLGFLNSRYGEEYLPRYVERCRQLNRLQTAFEASGRYPAVSYSDVLPIEPDTYRLSLLLSFVTTNHRFEILQSLTEFLKVTGTDSVPRTMLSIGFGSGYEIKLIQEHCPDWTILAFDNSAASHSYACDLLSYFQCGTDCLRVGTFPLEADEGIQNYAGCFGKIVMCEVLEHLEQPAKALSNLGRALHSQGRMFLTMAINIAQEDHIFLYPSVVDARRQVIDAGFRIVSEWATPVTVSPWLTASERDSLRKGNYICVVDKSPMTS